METTFRLNADELDEKWLLALKQMFQNESVIVRVKSQKKDTTKHLLSHPEQKKIILKSLQEAQNSDFIAANLEDYR